MRSIGLTLVAGLLLGCQTTTPNVATSPAASPAPKRAPEGYVITPHGLVHRECVREVGPGEIVDADGGIVSASGERMQLPPCTHPRLNPRTLEPIAAGVRAVAPDVNGWVEATYWTSPSPLGGLVANFPVPSAPSSNGATIFFFPGSEPADGSTILQPVLQYGPSAAGGGNYWAIASWFCCPAGWSNHSTLISVSSGQTVTGLMSSTCSGSSCNWTVTTRTSAGSTSLAAGNVTTPFVWNVGGVLEAYNVSACSQYPADGQIVFTNVALTTQGGGVFVPSWSNWLIGGSPSCNYSVNNTVTTATLTY